MLTEDLCDLIDAVAVLGEDNHPRASLVVAAFLLEANEMVQNDLLELCQLGMSDGQ